MKSLLVFALGVLLGVVVGVHSAGCPFLAGLCPVLRTQASKCQCEAPCCTPDCHCDGADCNCWCDCCPEGCKPAPKKHDCCKPKKEEAPVKKSLGVPPPEGTVAPPKMPPAKD